MALVLAYCSCSPVLRGRGAGVIQSSESWTFNGPLLFDVGDFCIVGAPVGLKRTIRGLLDLGGTGEVMALFPAGSRAGELRCAQGLWSNCDPAPFAVPSRRDGGDLSITEASSPRIAFASALNFIGGTGTSSSELSPIVNFHCCGNGSAEVKAMTESGEPRLGRGLGS